MWTSTSLQVYQNVVEKHAIQPNPCFDVRGLMFDILIHVLSNFASSCGALTPFVSSFICSVTFRKKEGSSGYFREHCISELSYVIARHNTTKSGNPLMRSTTNQSLLLKKCCTTSTMHSATEQILKYKQICNIKITRKK